jgi:proteasome lid subunit RPN8/RPN11
MIILTKSHLSELEDHARNERPNEACGILAGRENRVERIYKCKNISENPASHYVIEPEQLLEVFNDVADRGLEIIGFYHSHPAGPLGPSNIDLSEASWHECSYVILHPGGIGSWIWDEEKGQFVEEEIQIIPQ